MDGDTVQIIPSEVPNYAYEQACRVLYSSINRALADPKLRREYEEWQKKQNAAKSVV